MRLLNAIIKCDVGAILQLLQKKDLCLLSRDALIKAC